MAAPTDSNRALERSKVDLDPLSALLSAPPPPPPSSPPPAEADDVAAPPAPATAPASQPTPRREPSSFPYPPSSSTPRGTAPLPPPQAPLTYARVPPPLPPSVPAARPLQPSPLQQGNPFLASSASRGPAAAAAGGSSGSNGGAGDAMRQVGDVLNNLGSFLSSGLDSLSISLSGANANPGATGTGGTGGSGISGVGPSPPPTHTPQSPHPLSSPTFAAASLSPPSLAPSPTPSSSLLAGPQPRAPATEGNGGLSHPHRPGMEDPAAAVPMLSGEQRLASLPNFLLQTVHGVAIPGQLLITTYQVAFLPTPSRPLPPQLAHLPSSFFRLPMAAIDRTEREVRAGAPQGGAGGGVGPPSVALVLHTKDGRLLRLLPAAAAQGHDPGQPLSAAPLSTSPTAPPPPSSPGQQYQQQQEVGLERVKGLVDAYAFPNDREGPAARHLFCFAHHRALLAAGSTLAAPPPLLPPSHASTSSATSSWLEAEYARQFRLGADADGSSSSTSSSNWLAREDCPWRLTAINARHALCASYPALLVAPRLASDEELAACAAFRSEQRLPALTWGRPGSTGSLWRASQPRVGMAGASSPEDERVLRLIGAGLLALPGAGGQQGKYDGRAPGAGILRIMDLRNKTAAMANRATGHGYESSANYPSSVLAFCNIGNIHAMRESAQRLTQLAQSLATQDAEWGALVEGTKWLTHLRLVLSAAYRSAHAAAREHAAVLLHCSHGWDRTSQVAALAQLMLDPYYRTFDGFAVLVEKEFCAFGHPFQLRTAHGLDRHARSEEQLAPIFLQFLDATAQLLRQHPALFEFSPRYLLALADGLLDCRFGTFLCNTPKERAGPPVCTPAGSAATASVWTYLAHPAVRARLRNPLYCAAAAGGGGEGGGGGGGHAAATGYAHPQRILDTPLPSLLRRVALWADYWLRWAAKPSYPPEAYAAMRRVRETESRAKGRQTQQPPPGGEGGGGAADVMVPWAWLEEEAERALWAACSGPGLGVMGGEVGGQYEQEEEPLIDFVAPEPAPVAAAEKAVGGAASPAVSVVGTPRQEASEVEEEIDGFVDLVESAGSGALAGEEEAEMASEFME